MAYAKFANKNGRSEVPGRPSPFHEARRYMRVVTYARVSTKSQSDRGLSLEDQEHRFAAFLKSTGALRVKGYAEAKSAGTVAQRKTFVAMFDELPELNVDALVIDSLDRFTRDKFLGAEQFGKLRDMGVKLWELEHAEGRPLDMTQDVDRDYVWQKFGDAEAERRRIKKRQKKRYDEARTRGAATTNRPGFGLRLAGTKSARHLEPDPETAHIVEEVIRRLLGGEPQRLVLEWAQAMSPLAWKTRRGLQLALIDRNGAHTTAGLRSAETQQALNALRGGHRQTYGFDRANRSVARAAEGTYPLPEEREHNFAGLFACGKCVEAGIAPENALMHGRYIIANKVNPYNIACDGRRDGKQIHETWMATATRVETMLRDKMMRLRDKRTQDAVLAKLRYEPPRKGKKVRDVRLLLQQRIAELDELEATLDADVRGAMRLAASSNAAVVSEAERALESANAERMLLRLKRDSLNDEFMRLPTTAVPEREISALSRAFVDMSLLLDGMHMNDESKIVLAAPRDLLRPFIAALGYPVLNRRPALKRRIRLVLKWEPIDTLHPRDWAPPDYAEEPDVERTNVPPLPKHITDAMVTVAKKKARR